jgi:hypothetical protein
MNAAAVVSIACSELAVITGSFDVDVIPYVKGKDPHIWSGYVPVHTPSYPTPE